MDIEPKSPEFKAALSAVRAEIAAAKRRGTRSGFIDYYGCISVTNDLYGTLQDADAAAERGDFAFAYAVCGIVLINLAKLASTADDSAGGITAFRSQLEDVLAKICGSVEPGSPQAEYIYTQAIKDSQNKAFDGWDEFSYDLLVPVARLATERNKAKMHAALFALHSKLAKESYSSWADELDAVARLNIIRATGTSGEVDEFIAANLGHDDIRRIAIDDAMTAGDYLEAERLCLDRLAATDRDYHWTREWYARLFAAYEAAGDSAKQIDLADQLLIEKRDTKYFEPLKRLLIAAGKWESERAGLIATLSQNLPYHHYQDVLAKESEFAELLAVTAQHPASVLDYGKILAKRFPTETYQIFMDAIREQAVEPNTRKYKRVAASVKKLATLGGKVEALEIIDELKATYRRRTALIAELDKAAVVVEKKK